MSRFRILHLLVVLISIFKSSLTQAQIKEYITELVSTTNKAVPTVNFRKKTGQDKGILVSDPTLNRIFAKKLAYYLGSTGDLSLYKNYFSYDPSSDKVSISYNTAFPREDTKALLTLTSAALQVPLSKSLGLISKGGKTVDDIGVSIKQTFIMPGTLSFDPGLSDEMAAIRNDIQAILLKRIDAELNDFKKNLPQSPEQQEFVNQHLNKFQEGLYKKYRSEFSILEESALAEISALKNENYSICQNWITLKVYLPVTSSNYNFADNAYQNLIKKKFISQEMGLMYGRFYESKKISYVLTLGVNFINDNNIKWLKKYGTDISHKLGNIAELTQSKITSIVNGLGTANVALPTQTFYQGQFETFYVVNLQSRLLISLPSFNKFLKSKLKTAIGVSLDLFGDFNKSQYSVNNRGAGIVFALPVKEEAKQPINVELFFETLDYNGKLIPAKSRSEKRTIAVKLGLPFNSLIF